MKKFNFFKRKPGNSDLPASTSDPTRYKPGSPVYEVLRGVVTIFAETLTDQCRLLETMAVFKRAGFQIGPAFQFELCCFNLAFLRREFENADYSPKDIKELAVSCILWFGNEYKEKYGVQPFLDVINQRTSHYRDEIEQQWDEDEDHWDILFCWICSDVLNYIMSDGVDDLHFGPPPKNNGDADRETLYGRLAMSQSIATACLNTVPAMVYILREWRDTGRLFDMNEAEMRRLIPIAEAKAKAVIMEQLAEESDEE